MGSNPRQGTSYFTFLDWNPHYIAGPLCNDRVNTTYPQVVFGHWWSPRYKGFQKMKSGEVFCPFLKRSLAEHASPVEFHASCHETSVFILFRDAPNFSFIIVQKVCRMSIDEKSLKISKISLVFLKNASYYRLILWGAFDKHQTDPDRISNRHKKCTIHYLRNHF